MPLQIERPIAIAQKHNMMKSAYHASVESALASLVAAMRAVEGAFNTPTGFVSASHASREVELLECAVARRTAQVHAQRAAHPTHPDGHGFRMAHHVASEEAIRASLA